MKDLFKAAGVVFMVIILTMLYAYNNNLEKELADEQKHVVELKKERDELLEDVEELSMQVANTAPATHYELAASIYGVDKYMLEAIERLETGNYTSNIFYSLNNTYGAQVNGEYLSYNSAEQSTFELARLLRFNYFEKGLDTLEEIGAVFCPSNPEWASKVNEIYEEIKK